ncbi:MAG: hypothetical protein MI867_15335, partial [Pseudomonadales bacterium]|nr:hypothetical protein [Pseudomonadales bacterium]
TPSLGDLFATPPLPSPISDHLEHSLSIPSPASSPDSLTRDPSYQPAGRVTCPPSDRVTRSRCQLFQPDPAALEAEGIPNPFQGRTLPRTP